MKRKLTYRYQTGGLFPKNQINVGNPINVGNLFRNYKPGPVNIDFYPTLGMRHTDVVSQGDMRSNFQLPDSRERLLNAELRRQEDERRKREAERKKQLEEQRERQKKLKLQRLQQPTRPAESISRGDMAAEFDLPTTEDHFEQMAMRESRDRERELERLKLLHDLQRIGVNPRTAEWISTGDFTITKSQQKDLDKLRMTDYRVSKHPDYNPRKPIEDQQYLDRDNSLRTRILRGRNMFLDTGSPVGDLVAGVVTAPGNAFVNLTLDAEKQYVEPGFVQGLANLGNDAMMVFPTGAQQLGATIVRKTMPLKMVNPFRSTRVPFDPIPENIRVDNIPVPIQGLNEFEAGIRQSALDYANVVKDPRYLQRAAALDAELGMGNELQKRRDLFLQQWDETRAADLPFNIKTEKLSEGVAGASRIKPSSSNYQKTVQGESKLINLEKVPRTGKYNSTDYYTPQQREIGISPAMQGEGYVAEFITPHELKHQWTNSLTDHKGGIQNYAEWLRKGTVNESKAAAKGIASKNYRYHLDPTEIDAYLMTNLRNDLVNQGYMKDHFSKLSEDQLKNFINKNGKNLVVQKYFKSGQELVGDRTQFLNIFNKALPVVIPAAAAGAGAVSGSNSNSSYKNGGIYKYADGREIFFPGERLGAVSMEGYRSNSPDRFNLYNIIPSNNITMENVPYPVLGIDNTGARKVMYPGYDYNYPGSMVLEFPLKQFQGGGWTAPTGRGFNQFLPDPFSGVPLGEIPIGSRVTQFLPNPFAGVSFAPVTAPVTNAPNRERTVVVPGLKKTTRGPNLPAALGVVSGMSFLNSALEANERNKYREWQRLMGLSDSTGPVVGGSRGDYTLNEGYYRPDQYTPVQFGAFQQPASFQTGGTTSVLSMTTPPGISPTTTPTITPTTSTTTPATTPTTLPVRRLKPQEMQEWNQFLDFVKQSGYEGSTDLNARNKNLGADLFNKFKTSNPNITIGYDIVPSVQSEMQLLKQQAQDFARRRNDPNADKLMADVSPVDGWFGSRTSQFRFPSVVSKTSYNGQLVETQDLGLVNGSWQTTNRTAANSGTPAKKALPPGVQPFKSSDGHWYYEDPSSGDLVRYQQGGYFSPPRQLQPLPFLPAGLWQGTSTPAFTPQREGIVSERPSSSPIEFVDTGGTDFRPTGKDIATKTNNPGNMKWSKWMSRFGGYKSDIGGQDGGYFAAFPTVQSGLKAYQMQLFGDVDGIFKSSYYKSYTPVEKALRTWSGEGGYGEDIYPQIKGKTLGQLTQEERYELMKRQIKNESGSMYNRLAKAGVFETGGEYYVTPQQLQQILAHGGEVEFL